MEFWEGGGCVCLDFWMSVRKGYHLSRCCCDVYSRAVMEGKEDWHFRCAYSCCPVVATTNTLNGIMMFMKDFELGGVHHRPWALGGCLILLRGVLGVFFMISTSWFSEPDLQRFTH